MTSPATAVLICCGIYLVIVVMTSRGFVVAPLAQPLTARAAHCTTRAKFLAAEAAEGSPQALLRDRLVTGLKPIMGPTGWLTLNPLRWIVGLPLTKIAQYSSTVSAAEADLVDLVPETELSAWWATTQQHLSTVEPASAKALAEAYQAQAQANDFGPSGQRVFVQRSQEIINDRRATTLDLQLDRHRVAFWLAAVGLAGVIAIGLFLGHDLTMLAGALGGFLAPVVSTLVSKKVSVWGVMVLSPVGGALTSIGGLLLVRFLADPAIGLLGATFAGYWSNSDDPPALAVALLFGFSGRLFSRLAISATSQIGSDQPATNAQTTAGQTGATSGAVVPAAS